MAIVTRVRSDSTELEEGPSSKAKGIMETERLMHQHRVRNV